MGVDLSLHVLADYGPYAVASFRLNRDRDLFPQIECILKPLGGGFQLQNGSWCALSDGERPPECEDRELGWLFKDSYGTPIRYCLGSDLAAFAKQEGLNGSILAFIASNYATNKIVAFFH